MRQANGTGSVYKLKGNRRRPFTAVISTGIEIVGDKARVKRKTLGYYATQKEARQALAEYNAMNLRSDAYELTLDNIWQQIYAKKEETASKTRLDHLKSAYKHLLPIQKRIFKDLKTVDLQKCFDDCVAKSGTQVVMKYILTSCYKYAIENDICVKNYADFIVIEKSEVQLEREILSERVCGFESSPKSAFNDITLILLYTGMRINELLKNNAMNFNDDDMSLTIPKGIAKNKTSARIIPIHEQIQEPMRRFFALEERPTYQQTYKWMKSQGFTPHSTRHTFATRCHECGLNELCIQRLLGHTPKTITQAVYTHISLEELRTEMDKFYYPGLSKEK